MGKNSIDVGTAMFRAWRRKKKLGRKNYSFLVSLNASFQVGDILLGTVSWDIYSSLLYSDAVIESTPEV